jgi:hypothetical protein
LQCLLKEKILFFLDLDTSKIDNVKIFHPEHLQKFKLEKVIISVFGREDSISTYLVNDLHVEASRIISFNNNL